MCAVLIKMSIFVALTTEYPLLWTRTSYLRIAELLDVEPTELVRTKKSQTNHPSF